MQKKLLMVLLVLALMVSVGVVTAQDEMADYEGVDPSGQTITYWHQWDGAQLEAMAAIIEDFNTNNEWGITVEPVGQGGVGEIRDLMSAAITTGDLPNIAAGFLNDAQSWYLDNAVITLDALFESETWGYDEMAQEDLIFSLVDQNRAPTAPFDNALMMWPIGFSANVFFVNTAMAMEAGLESGLPTTFDEVRTVACGAAELEGPDGADIRGWAFRTNANDVESLIAGAGGAIFDFEANEYTFTDEGTIEALTLMQDLFEQGCAYFPDSNFGHTADLAFGLNPMAISSTAGLPFVLGDIEESGSGVEFALSATPAGANGAPTIQAFLTSLAIIDSTPEAELASWLFLKHLATTQSQVTWTEGTSYLPYTQSAREGIADFLATNPYLAAINELLGDDSVKIYSSPQVLSYGAVRDIISELAAAVTTGGEDVAEAAARFEAEANEIHAESLEDMEAASE